MYKTKLGFLLIFFICLTFQMCFHWTDRILQNAQPNLNKPHGTVGVKQPASQTSDWVVKFNVMSPERLPRNPVLCGAWIPNVSFIVWESMANPTLELLGLVAECSICRLMYSVQAQWPSAAGDQELWYHHCDATWMLKKYIWNVSDGSIIF